jgi:RNA polymerase sigma-70 factor (ECF subfamily)
MEQTPRSLLEKLRHDADAASWKRLVDLYTPLIQTWLRQQGIPAADVDDLAQDALAVLVQKLPTFEHDGQRGAFRCWLRRIILNLVRGFWRDRGGGAAGTQDSALLDQVPDPASDPDQRWEQEHDRFIIRRALELLQPEFTATTWQAFRRLVFDGAKPAEVAAELGLTANAVVLAKFRVLRRLQQELEGLTD